MKNIKRASYFIALVAFITSILLIPSITFAQQAPKCDGPAELCLQVLDLQTKLNIQKAIVEKDKGEKSEAAKVAEKSQSDKMAKAVAAAASIAVILKLILSGMKIWKPYFTTDKGKAWLKIVTIIIGFAAFLLTNRGLGLAWWQALIVASGGPGSIMVYELQKLVPVLRGKAPMPPEEPTPEEPKV